MLRLSVALLVCARACLGGSAEAFSTAAALSKRHEYASAVALRTALLDRADAPLSAYAAQSQDLLALGRPQDALAVIKDGQKRALERKALDVFGVLGRAGVRAHLCLPDAGAPAEALRRFRALRKVEAETLNNTRGFPDDPWLELDLQSHLLSTTPPPSVVELLARARAGVTHALLSAPNSPWVHPLQLPRNMVRGLPSRPWHSVDPAVRGAYPALSAWVASLTTRTSALRAEFLRLAAQGLVEEERECIHTPRPVDTVPSRLLWQGGGDGEALRAFVPPATWKAFIVDAAWTDAAKLDSTGCNSVDAPEACALREELSASPGTPAVVRVSFSALGPGAYLHPHFGQTNAFLKLHLGLSVPYAGSSGGGGSGEEAQPCAHMRVGNTTRAWAEGEVLFFDDSYEHTVTNECDQPRVILQVLFQHPDHVPRVETGGVVPPKGGAVQRKRPRKVVGSVAPASRGDSSGEGADEADAEQRRAQRT